VHVVTRAGQVKSQIGKKLAGRGVVRIEEPIDKNQPRHLIPALRLSALFMHEKRTDIFIF
jgi:hypothetical protein